MNLQEVLAAGADSTGLDALGVPSAAAEFAAVLQLLVPHVRGPDTAAVACGRPPGLPDRRKPAAPDEPAGSPVLTEGGAPAAGAEASVHGHPQVVSAPAHGQPVWRVTWEMGPEEHGDGDAPDGGGGAVRGMEEPVTRRQPRQQELVTGLVAAPGAAPALPAQRQAGEHPAEDTAAAAVREAFADAAGLPAPPPPRLDHHGPEEHSHEAALPRGGDTAVDASPEAPPVHAAASPQRADSSGDAPPQPVAPHRGEAAKVEKVPSTPSGPARPTASPGLPRRAAASVRPPQREGLPPEAQTAGRQPDPDRVEVRAFEPKPAPAPAWDGAQLPGLEGEARSHLPEEGTGPEVVEVAAGPWRPEGSSGHDAADSGAGAGDGSSREAADRPEVRERQTARGPAVHASALTGHGHSRESRTSRVEPAPEVRAWQERPEPHSAPHRLQVEVPDARGDPVRVDVRARSEAVWVRVEGGPEVGQAVREGQLPLQHALGQHGLSLAGLEVDTLPRSRRRPEDLPPPVGQRTSPPRRPSAVRVVEGSVDYVV